MKKKPQDEKPEKFPLTEDHVVMFEAAASLQFASEFERDFIEDFKKRFLAFGYNTKITEKQIDVLKVLYNRYKKVRPSK